MTNEFNENPILNERWLKWASFWVKHRNKFRLGAIVVVVVVEAMLLIYSGYYALDYFVLSRERDLATERELTRSTNVLALHEAMAPMPISTQAAVVLPGTRREGRYDVLIKFLNSNPNWVATVKYKFDSGQEDEQEVLILNDAERFVVGAGVARSLSERPNPIILDVKWKRLREPEAINLMKPNFVVSDVRFTPSTARDKNGSLIPGQVQFTITNESIFSFWAVDFTIVLLQGDRPVAARALSLEQVKSTEQREVTVNLFTTITGVSNVLVVPHVNIVDAENFMYEEGDPIRF